MGHVWRKYSRLLMVERFERVLQGDEELSILQHRMGFCINTTAGAHLHSPCHQITRAPDAETLRLLETPCRTGTAAEVLELLTRVGLAPFENEMVRGCKAASKRLPMVPSRVAPPNFTTVKKDEEDEEFPRIMEDRQIPMLVVSCHEGNEEVARLLVKRFGAGAVIRRFVRRRHPSRPHPHSLQFM